MKKITSKIILLALALVFTLGYNATVASAQSVTATNITCNSTVFQGEVSINPSGTPTNIWFQWGRSSVLENNTNQQMATYSSPFSQAIYNLSPSTTYYYRAVANNAPFGTVYGETFNFTTPSCGPSTVVNYNTNVTRTVSTVRAVSNQLVRTRVVSSQASLVNLSIVADNERVCSGENIGYTIEYVNVSNQTLKNVVLRVAIPGELSFKGSSSGVFSEKDNTLTVEIGNLSPDEKGRVTMRTSVTSAFSENNTIVTTASLVYTTTEGVQEEATAYSLSKFGCYAQSNGAWALYGGNFFPTTLIGWLILIIILVIIVILSRRVYGSYQTAKK